MPRFKCVFFLSLNRKQLITTALLNDINSKHLSETLLHREVNGQVHQLYSEFCILYADRLNNPSLHNVNEVSIPLTTVFTQTNSIKAQVSSKILPSAVDQHRNVFHSLAIPLFCLFNGSASKEYEMFIILEVEC